MRWICNKCKEEKDENEFYRHIRHSNGRTARCKSCISEYWKENIDRTRERNKKNRAHMNEYKREHRRKNRDDFLSMYGNKCECCGESHKIFLTLDHVKGQVGRQKENSHVAYAKAVKKLDKSSYRILCHNCNQAVRFGDICPHQMS